MTSAFADPGQERSELSVVLQIKERSFESFLPAPTRGVAAVGVERQCVETRGGQGGGNRHAHFGGIGDDRSMRPIGYLLSPAVRAARSYSTTSRW